MRIARVFVLIASLTWLAVFPSYAAVSAHDLQGTWVATWDNNNEITISATGQNTFSGRYTNINNDNIFQGRITDHSITVRQLYADGRLYGTYTFSSISPTMLQGSLVDYARSYNNVTWRKKASLAASDLQGTWVATWDNNNEITISATGQNTFSGRYTNINNDNIFQGRITGHSITVRQLYADGRLYGTYTFSSVSPTLLQGSLVDYARAYNNVVWRRK